MLLTRGQIYAISNFQVIGKSIDFRTRRGMEKMDFQQLLGILIFTCTTTTYLTFLVLGRKWRKNFERKGIRYWKAPKEQRIRELMNDVWQPKLITVFYGLACFTNGYMKIAYSMWTPLFLLQVRGVDN